MTALCSAWSYSKGEKWPQITHAGIKIVPANPIGFYDMVNPVAGRIRMEEMHQCGTPSSYDGDVMATTKKCLYDKRQALRMIAWLCDFAFLAACSCSDPLKNIHLPPSSSTSQPDVARS